MTHLHRTTLVEDLTAAGLSKPEIALLNRVRSVQGQQVLYLRAPAVEVEVYFKARGIVVPQIASVRDEWCAVRLGLRDLWSLAVP